MELLVKPRVEEVDRTERYVYVYLHTMICYWLQAVDKIWHPLPIHYQKNFLGIWCGTIVPDTSKWPMKFPKICGTVWPFSTMNKLPAHNELVTNDVKSCHVFRQKAINESWWHIKICDRASKGKNCLNLFNDFRNQKSNLQNLNAEAVPMQKTIHRAGK